MRIEKKTLNDVLRILGKVVCQTSPVELYRSIRFTGDEDGAMAMATDGVEVISVMLDAFAENEFDFCVPFKDLKDLVRASRSETLELAGIFIEFPAFEEPAAEAETVELDSNFCEYLAQAAPIINRQEYRKVLQGINLSRSGITVTDGKHLKLSTVQQAFDDLTNVWDVMFPVERYKFINEVVEKITVHIDRVEIEYKTDGLEAVITETEKANGKND